MDQTFSAPNYLELTADLVSAYVSHNALPLADLPSLIDAVHTALRQASSVIAEQVEPAPKPPVPIRKSITPDRTRPPLWQARAQKGRLSDRRARHV
jgi:predicted transcriptional regulator